MLQLQRRIVPWGSKAPLPYVAPIRASKEEEPEAPVRHPLLLRHDAMMKPFSTASHPPQGSEGP